MPPRNAILAANENDVIRVAPGLYRENVVVTKTLRLEGAQAGKSAGDKKRFNIASDAAESVIQPVLGAEDESGFNTGISVEEVAQASTIDGFTIRGFGTGSGYQVGIGGGANILNNRIIDTTIGLGYSLVNNVTIQGNAFLNNRSKSGATFLGYGIYFEGALTTALIDGNVFAGNGGANIFSSVQTATDVTISNNLMDSSLSSAPQGAAAIKAATANPVPLANGKKK